MLLVVQCDFKKCNDAHLHIIVVHDVANKIHIATMTILLIGKIRISALMYLCIIMLVLSQHFAVVAQTINNDTTVYCAKCSECKGAPNITISLHVTSVAAYAFKNCKTIERGQFFQM